MNRCKWPNLESSKLYMDYHDEQWGVAVYDDAHLFEMFILESFHCGLSWLLILKKREAFREAFDGFDASQFEEVRHVLTRCRRLCLSLFYTLP